MEITIVILERNVMRRLVAEPITVNNFAVIVNCTPAGRALNFDFENNCVGVWRLVFGQAHWDQLVDSFDTA